MLIAILPLVSSCKAPPQSTDAQKIYSMFSDTINKKDYDTAYQLLSKDTRKRYSGFEFMYMFSKTLFGKLLRNMVLNWKQEFLTFNEKHSRTKIVIHHPTQTRYKKNIELVREGNEWKVRFTIAELMDMPESDERYLFPESFDE
jgi:hypothetical protein